MNSVDVPLATGDPMPLVSVYSCTTRGHAAEA
jgi:hypothetical protein